MRLSRISLIALGLMAAGAAQAQSNVTLYGIVDLYMQVGKGDTTLTQLQSGGLSGSRWGLKGSEDLGNGLKALFVLESGINADTGTLGSGGALFSRQAYVGLGSVQAGNLLFGRQRVPHYDAIGAADAFDQGAGSSSSSGIVSGNTRTDNAIVWQSPKWLGFSVNAMAALGEKTTGGSRNADVYSVAAQYASGPALVGLAWRQTNKPTDADFNASHALLTAAYDFGAFKLMGGLQHVNNFAGQAWNDRNEGFIGARIPVWARDQVWLGMGGVKVHQQAGRSATQWSVGYDHPMSKRTDLYGVATRIRNGSLATYTTDAATGAGPVVTVGGRDVNALQLGIRHRF
jgi:predicted porin